MSRVILIAPLTDQFSGILDYGAPALGVHRVASYLRQHGHEVEVYDCNLQGDEWLTNQLTARWDIIGISILADTLYLSLEMFLRLRQAQPGALLVAGGPEATLNYQDIFDLSDCDVCVLGDGERPMLRLCDGEGKVQNIPGTIWRHYALPMNDGILANYFHDLNFADMGWREYWVKNEEQGGDVARKNKLVRVVTASHCSRVNPCSFCSVNRIREFACGKVVKPASLGCPQIRDLIAGILHDLPETTHIYFIEDSFLPLARDIDEFCAVLSEFKDRVKYLGQVEVNSLSREIVNKLADAGFIHLSCGVESASNRLRKVVGKPIKAEKIEDVIQWCNACGIRCYYLIILFIPESTMKDLWQNYETLTRWQAENRVGVSVMPYMIPYRGAPVWTSEHQFGYERKVLSNGKVLKRPTVVWPSDPEVRKVMEEFMAREKEYVEAHLTEHGRRSKDYTGRLHVELLGEILREVEE